MRHPTPKISGSYKLGVHTHSGVLAILLSLMIGFNSIWALPEYVVKYGGLYVWLYTACLFLFGLPFILAELVLGSAARAVKELKSSVVPTYDVDQVKDKSVDDKALSQSHVQDWLQATGQTLLPGVSDQKNHSLEPGCQPADPVAGLAALARAAQKKLYWRTVIKLSLVVCAFVVAAYAVVSGWSMAFLIRTVSGVLTNDVDAVQRTWIDVSQHAESGLFWYLIIGCLSVIVLARSLPNGLETYSKRLMLVLLASSICLIYMAIAQGDWKTSLHLMFRFDQFEFSSVMLYDLLIHAFYSLMLGTGAAYMLGMYTPKTVSLPTVVIQAISLNTVFSLVMCFAVLAFMYNTQDTTAPVLGSSFELAYLNLPTSLSVQPYGQVSLAIFYLIVFAVGLSTCFVALEPLVALMVAKLHYSRLKSVRLLIFYIGILGAMIIFSFSIWRDQTMSLSPKVGDKIYTWFEDVSLYVMLTYLIFKVLLPIVALLMVYVAGFVVKQEHLRAQLPNLPNPIYKVWFFFVRNITPVIILAVWVYTSGILDGLKLWFGWDGASGY